VGSTARGVAARRRTGPRSLPRYRPVALSHPVAGITSPFDPVLFFNFTVTTIIVDVQVLARRQGGVAQIVADQSQIHLLVGHVGTRAMPEPVG
jgi:hypothetical protein